MEFAGHHMLEQTQKYIKRLKYIHLDAKICQVKSVFAYPDKTK